MTTGAALRALLRQGRVVAYGLVLVGGIASGCGDDAASERRESDAHASWQQADAAWQARRVGAHALWLALDIETTDGRRAHQRLARADARYRDGIARLARGDLGARTAFERAAEIGPMNPELYLPLARAYRDRGFELRAAQYYSKYLTMAPAAGEAALARSELAALELDPELADVLEPVEMPDSDAVTAEAKGQGRASGPDPTAGPSVWKWTAAGLGVGAALALLASVLVLSWRKRGRSLDVLVERHPEWHPAIAYLVGALRHELLKHRVGAVAHAVLALERGEATIADREFLLSRLYGGQPILAAWAGHLGAFERTLGYHLDLGRDRHFRRASRALRVMVAVQAALLRGDRRAISRLGRAHRTLLELDDYLSGLGRSLVRCQVDRELVDHVLGEVCSEYGPSQVALDDLSVEPVPADISVEVFRVDLVLILKNLVRNAILAAGAGAAPRRVRITVATKLVPTGDEVVRIAVHDTGDDSLTTEAIREQRVDRGLGLVMGALLRYDGSIRVEPGTDGYAKSIAIRFFRASDDEAQSDSHDGEGHRPDGPGPAVSLPEGATAASG